MLDHFLVLAYVSISLILFYIRYVINKVRYMDYDNFIKDWENMNVYDKNEFKLTSRHLEGKHATNDRWLKIAPPVIEDRVNSPSHYTRGSQEVIVTIEEAIDEAPSVSLGMLQGQVLKYLLRVWHKDNPLEDLKKAQWYLNRLISKMEGE